MLATCMLYCTCKHQKDRLLLKYGDFEESQLKVGEEVSSRLVHLPRQSLWEQLFLDGPETWLLLPSQSKDAINELVLGFGLPQELLQLVPQVE